MSIVRHIHRYPEVCIVSPHLLCWTEFLKGSVRSASRWCILMHTACAVPVPVCITVGIWKLELAIEFYIRGFKWWGCYCYKIYITVELLFLKCYRKICLKGNKFLNSVYLHLYYSENCRQKTLYWTEKCP
jgi:hypothetical protein